MTLLQLINRVLVRLREDSVSTMDDSYTQLLRELASDIHEEVVNYHDWGFFEQDITTTLVDGTRVYTLDSTTADSQYRAIAGTHVFDTSSEPQGTNLYVIHWDELERKYQEDRNLEREFPTFVAYRPDLSGDGIKMAVWPTPNSSGYTIRHRFYTPEAIITDSTAATYEFSVPSAPLVRGLLYLALNERGEELGEPGGIAEQRYYRALERAAEADKKAREGGNEYEFVRD